MDNSPTSDSNPQSLLETLTQIIRAQVISEQRQPTGSAAALQRLMTAKQAALYISRSEQAVRHLVFQREIPVVRVGRSVRIDRKDLDNWIENNKC